MVDPDATAMDPGAATSEPPSEFPCHRCGKPTGPGWVACAWCGTELTSASELANGTTLADGRYQLDGVIGRGGFGITYRGIDHRLERPIAVKEMFPESAVRRGEAVVTAPADRVAFQAARERFIREARVLARFSHPGIVRVFEVFEENATAYLVMELLEGRTLVDVLRQHGRPLGSEDIVDLAARIAAALRPVHAAGVLHRDVNPSNVILTDHGRIVVIDFGTATTYDAVSAKGEYLGGVIAPGMEISLDALYTRAAALRRVELVEPRSVIGRTTVESIQAGALFGFAGQVDGICRRMTEELGDLTVVATGGLAEWVAPHTTSIEHIEPWLTLHGLRLVFARNS